MSDLINRQQAMDVLEEQLDYLLMLNKKDNPTAESKWYGVNQARNTIAELPTAEPTIDLVMCGECKYWHEGRCWNIKGLNKTDGIVNADDFCSYGERKTDEKSL